MNFLLDNGDMGSDSGRDPVGLFFSKPRALHDELLSNKLSVFSCKAD
jgi:hypothetical protein